MNTSTLKTYAPQARKDFIQAVTDRAAVYGLTKKKTKPITVEGDVAVIAGKAYPKVVAEQRASLEERIEHDGFYRVMEAIAYTWFNRFVAIRYMELHGYLDHGYRVLSNPDAGKADPEILEHAQHVDFPGGGLKKDIVVELKLDGTKDEELYRLLLVAQCNALHRAMPFLFERVSDETELLLPDNLLHSDSLIRRLVKSIDEADWQEVEIIGWIYQFYISEKKEEVIGKVVKSEDIPAATQLFTPNWIVKYMVQNSLGAQWLSTYPDSKLKEQMEYYIEPAEQTPEVQAQLKAITPESLNPEELTLMDPACGSGHILVEAYDLFKAIYQERGYRAKDIPQLILKKNLFGLEIDDRAAQLASFALIMKARADDRRVLEGDITHNVRCIQSSDGLDAEAVFEALTGQEPEPLPPGEDFDFMEEVKTPLIAEARRSRSATVASGGEVGFSVDGIRMLLSLFNGDDAKTFGSLIQIPEGLAKKLPEILERTTQLISGDDLNRQRLAARFMPIAQQAQLLGWQYVAVVANPPYMGSNGINPRLKTFLASNYKEFKSDLFAAFSKKIVGLVSNAGFAGLVTPFTWMNLTTYEHLRRLFVLDNSLTSLIRPEYHSFFDSAYVPLCTFTIQRFQANYCATFIDLNSFVGEDEQPRRAREAIVEPKCSWRFTKSLRHFCTTPLMVIAYSLSDAALRVFEDHPPLNEFVDLKQGLITGDNEQFLRHWQEIDLTRSSINNEREGAKWFPYQKGGAFRKWYGNHEYVVNWENDGEQIRNLRLPSGRQKSRPQNTQYYFREGCTWTSLTISKLSMRYVPEGYAFDAKGPMLFPKKDVSIYEILGYTNSNMINHYLRELAPTMDYSQGPVGNAPYPLGQTDIVVPIVKRLIDIAKGDWDLREESWDFSVNPLLAVDGAHLIEEAWDIFHRSQHTNVLESQDLEQQINTAFRLAANVDVSDGIIDKVEMSEVTLYLPSRKTDARELVSYAIGCMMGRYSLDEPGLIYAHSGNEGFDPAKYSTFPADADGIVPITDYEWFDDDATHRFVEFIGVAWSKEHLQENLKFVADNLGSNRGEQPRDTIRRYLASGFYKDHLQTYKKRPIYWLFSSGKQQAFQALVYLHRYNEGTLSRMRTEYVIPLIGKVQARIEHLKHDIAATTLTSHRNKLQKEHDALRKQLAELAPVERTFEKIADDETKRRDGTFDEKLRQYADQRIALDLDDGVKVNYGKFGDLLAEVKAVTGKKPD
jgi:Eco57I restriction-modification methylase